MTSRPLPYSYPGGLCSDLLQAHSVVCVESRDVLSEGGDYKDCETGDASFGGRGGWGGGGGDPGERELWWWGGGGWRGPGERIMVCELFVTCGLRGDG